MLIAWTTVASRDAAEELARTAIERRLAVCVQVEGPIHSIYRWVGRIEQAEEYRLAFKFTAGQAAALEAHVLARHPYETPEWVVVQAQHVGEKYLSWAQANSNSSPF